MLRQASSRTGCCTTFRHRVTDCPKTERRGPPASTASARPDSGGPCPPKKDHAHHYHFHVYALDVESLGPSGLSKEDAVNAMRGHIVAEGESVGTYKRAA